MTERTDSNPPYSDLVMLELLAIVQKMDVKLEKHVSINGDMDNRLVTIENKLESLSTSVRENSKPWYKRIFRN